MLDHSPAELALLASAIERQTAREALLQLNVTIASVAAVFGGKEARDMCTQMQSELDKTARGESTDSEAPVVSDKRKNRRLVAAGFMSPNN